MSELIRGEALEHMHIDLAENGGSAAEKRQREVLARRDKGPSSREATGGWVDWDSQSAYLGQPFDAERSSIKVLRQMRRDPMIAFGLMLRKLPMIRAQWYMKSEDPRRAAFADAALRRIYGRLVLQYGGAFDFGYQAVVKRFELDNPDWKYLDKELAAEGAEDAEKKVWPHRTKALLWKHFQPISPERAHPSWNAKGEFNGITYSAADKGSGDWLRGARRSRQVPDIRLPWALWFINERDSVFGDFYGWPVPQYAKRYWWSYWYEWGFVDRSFERWADPPMKGYYPSGELTDSGERVNYQTVMLDLMEQARSGALVAFPSDLVEGGLEHRPTSQRAWDIEPMEHNAQFAELRGWAEYLDVMKMRSVWVPEQAVMEGKGGTSSRNVAEVESDLLMELQMVPMQELDHHINRHMLPQLMEENFGPGPAVEKITTGFDTVDSEMLREFVRWKGQQDPDGLGVDMDEVLRQLGIPRLSYGALQAALAKQAEAAAATAPDAVEPDSGGQNGAGAAAGVVDTGFGERLYVAPRERIDLEERLTVYLVDELPLEGHEGDIAFFDEGSMSMHVRRDSDRELAGAYMSAAALRMGARLCVEGTWAEDDEREEGPGGF